DRSRRRYARWPALARWAFGNLSGVAAQAEADAQRFASLGAKQVTVTGNVKFDMEVPAAAIDTGKALRARFGEARRTWVAGSTREGEEALLLDAFAGGNYAADVLLVIVPRHPQRFDSVVELARRSGLATQRRSESGAIDRATRVVIGDSMGEMLAYYASADVAIMGGSLLEFGSQNLIEPCAVGTPVILGPHTWNFSEAADGALAAGAAVRVADAAGALREADAVSSDRARRDAMGRGALSFVSSHRGAVGRFTAWLAQVARAPRS
ncbi:MAG TPA: glycosyltransferase N-terminal domain-containing protein, partial [Usitatibacter sp.]|nr:glycosyltransferase N-terminal domain-containing protein [Usitatibacter sp.]